MKNIRFMLLILITALNMQSMEKASPGLSLEEAVVQLRESKSKYQYFKFKAIDMLQQYVPITDSYVMHMARQLRLSEYRYQIYGVAGIVFILMYWLSEPLGNRIEL
ncbi:MAG TPA: hypothetical protein PLU71_03245 [Candidatus Dependentiae bacterium]|nr:hypothetical protein [Candidatus Dependentiae bacterium]HRQ62847.1 hypothetical protein [Candidatus Dependentiae bacterium]